MLAACLRSASESNQNRKVNIEEGKIFLVNSMSNFIGAFLV